MKKIIINYLNDTISSEEKERLTIWLQKPKNQEKFKDFVRLNNDLNSLNKNFNADNAYKIVSEKIKINSDAKTLRFPNFLKYAAVLIGFSIIGYGVFFKNEKTNSIPSTSQITLKLEDGSLQILEDNQTSFIVDSHGNKISEQKNNQLIYVKDSTPNQILRYNTLKVPFGKRFELLLSDGSKITLNSGSELTYPVQFIESESTRTVFLNGEAYFEVEKHAFQPFLVNTKNMDVEVLGTKFNVTSYSDDKTTYTVLVEGKVAAHNKLRDETSKVLKPNEKVFFQDNNLITEVVDTKKYIAWINGELIFKDDSFQVITNKLERHFDIKINNSYTKLDAIKITGTFKNETIEQVLKTFQTYEPFDYVIKNKVINITKPK